jgi:hypothetical protein
MQQQLLRERERESTERERKSPHHAAAVAERAGVLVLHLSSYHIRVVYVVCSSMRTHIGEHVSSYYICVLILLHI